MAMKRTREADDRFFELITTSEKSIVDAAEEVGYTISGVYYHKRNDPEFAERWEMAKEIKTQIMEAEADRRAIHGVDRPVYFQGQRVDEYKEYSDQLLMFRLKAMRPEAYKEKGNIVMEHVGPGGGPIIHSAMRLEELSADERKALREIIVKRIERPEEDSGGTGQD